MRALLCEYTHGNGSVWELVVYCIVSMFRVLLLTLATTTLADASAGGELAGVLRQDPASREALRRLFDKYGGRESGRITFEGFEHLLESLGLGHVVMEDHDVHDHQTDDGGFRSLHDDDHVHTDAPPSYYRAQDAFTAPSRDQQSRRRRSADDDIVQQSTADGTNISQVRIIVELGRIACTAYTGWAKKAVHFSTHCVFGIVRVKLMRLSPKCSSSF